MRVGFVIRGPSLAHRVSNTRSLACASGLCGSFSTGSKRGGMAFAHPWIERPRSTRCPCFGPDAMHAARARREKLARCRRGWKARDPEGRGQKSEITGQTGPVTSSSGHLVTPSPCHPVTLSRSAPRQLVISLSSLVRLSSRHSACRTQWFSSSICECSSSVMQLSSPSGFSSRRDSTQIASLGSRSV